MILFLLFLNTCEFVSIGTLDLEFIPTHAYVHVLTIRRYLYATAYSYSNILLTILLQYCYRTHKLCVYIEQDPIPSVMY